MVENAKPKILCIEDEFFISELYARALKAAGYDVTIVSDGEQGLREATSNHYDAILLDIMLPTMNGMEVLHGLKDPSVQPAVTSKIVITTNLDQEEHVREKVEEMADGYLIKAELTPKELVNYVQQVMANS